MIDLILYAPAGKAAFATFGRNHPPANPLLQDDGEGNTIRRDGVDFCWWAGSGDFKTQNGTYDGEGNEITPPTFAPGAVALVRILPTFFNDRLIPDDLDPDKEEQWARSRVAKYIKENGTPGTMAGGTIPYYELDGVRILRPTDVEAFLAANNLAGHIWLGGNSY